MVEENLSQKFRLKNKDETRNYFVKKIEQNEMMSKKHKKVSTILNYKSIIKKKKKKYDRVALLAKT